MTRAALFARYSSDNQSEASIEDQFRLCRERAGQEQWQIVGSYEVAAILGAVRSGGPASSGSCVTLQRPAGRGAGPDQPRPGRCRHALQAVEVRGRHYRHLG